MKNWLSLLLWGGVLVIALALRLPNLTQRPMHTDEAVHAFKLAELLQSGSYRYDADEYHGPTLYYFTAITAFLRGQKSLSQLDELTLRLTPVCFGVGLIALMMLAIPLIGKRAAWLAACWIAISPVQVFYSRYFIQEVLFVFFAILCLLALWRYYASLSRKWLLLAGGALGLLHATKETDIIAVGMAMVALIIVWIDVRLRSPSAKGKEKHKAADPAATAFSEQPNFHLSRIWWFAVDGLILLIPALVISFVCLSSFFAHPQGAMASVTAYTTYFRRGAGQTVHLHPWYYYVKLLFYGHAPHCPFFSEAWILPFTLIGIIRSWQRVIPVNKRLFFLFRRFFVCFIVGVLLVYSVLPYKTPWNILLFHYGVLFLGGVGLMDAVQKWEKKAAMFIIYATMAAAMMIVQTFQLNGKYAHDPCNPWVYAHPGDDVQIIARILEKAAAVVPDSCTAKIEVIVPNHEYWPLPWTLRRLGGIGWHDRVDEHAPAAPIVLVTPDLESALTQKLYGSPALGQQHLYMRLWREYRELRPGVEIRGFVRKDVWDQMGMNDQEMRKMINDNG